MGLNEQGFMQTVCKCVRLPEWRTLKSTIVWCDILLREYQIPNGTRMSSSTTFVCQVPITHSLCLTYSASASLFSKNGRIFTEKYEVSLCRQHGVLLYISLLGLADKSIP